MSQQARPTPEPIAIVGIGCRFPGAPDSRAFWELVRDGVDAIGDIPADRFDAQAFYDPTPGARGRIITRQGGFLADVDRFDASFFGISPREATCMDPQQRLLLEVAWEAFEDAGVTQERLAGSATGVFIGMWTSEYESRMFGASPDIDLYVTTGGGRYAASGRLSYAFDLRGPSLTVDTACSSSLVAVHLACQSLRSGESEMALVGGVNLILEPHISIGYSRSAMLSPDGRCRFGDRRASGYVRSEGVGLVLLKPLSQALAEGDPIHALIRGSAVNNDGQGSGLLVAPSPAVQAAMLHRAYQVAGVDPGCVGYVEAHGTGTRVGDPVELAALGEVLGHGRAPGRPCRTGSVKTNIGHAEAASGIAGLIKAAFCLEHRLIPPSLHYTEPNPRIPWDQLPVVVVRALEPWPEEFRPAFAGVNSFGVTGTNAHVVLEAPPASAASTTGGNAVHRIRLLPLSAKSSQGLGALAERWVRRLQGDDVASRLDDLCYTASLRRTHHADRLAVVGASGPELAERLRAHLHGEARPGLVAGRTKPARRRVVFVFPGQGSQWLGMGRSLLATEPVFADAIEQCDRALAPHVTWSLLDELTADGDHSRLDRIDVIQPILFALQVAQAALWRSWGVEPEAVIGHSMGEVAAAHVAGALSLPDAARIIAVRSRLLRRIAGRGAMAVVELSFDAAQLALAGREDRLSIAVSNSPRATVISGDVAALDALLVELEGRGIFCRRIRVEVASHSAHVDELRADLMNALVDLEPRPTSVELYSTVTGGALDGARLGAEYWACNLRQPVLFSTAIRRLAADGLDAFIEMSSHPILLAAVQDSLQDAGSEGVLRLPSGRREEDEGVVMRESLATLWVQGYPLDWSRLLSTPSHTPTRVVSLPTYPWQRDRFWHEAAVTRTQPRTEEPLLTVTSGVDSARPRAGAMAELFHRVEWHPHARPRTSARPHGRWLIVADGEQPAAALVARLEAAGEECVVRSAVHALRRELGETLASEPPITGCVHLASVGIDPHASPTEGLAADNGWASALALVQAVVERAAPVAPRLWLVTRGAQRIGADDGPVSLGAAAEWGFGAAIGYEHPALHATRVDLAWHPGAMDMASLTEELLGADGEDQIALRGTTRYVARLIRQAPPDAPSDSQGTLISPEGSYLVTGGTGGIGLVLARWLVDCGARDLTLMGRRAPSPHVDRVVEELRSMGAEVSVARGDVTRREDVQRVVAESSRRRPLLGVIHAAGALDDGLLADLHHERFTRVLATKVDGAIHLGEATHNAALDFFVCFSSVVGVLGSPGVLNYAVANAALDAVATQSHRLRHPMLSVAWGPWNRLGMAGRRDAAQELGVLSVAEAIDALKRVLAVHATGLLVMRFDPARWSRVFPVGASSLLCELNAVAGPVAETTTALDRIRAAAPGERRALLEGHLREHVAHALRVAVSHVDRSVLLKDLGLNSLLSLELRNRLETSLGIILPATLVWNYPTVAALAAHLEERLELAAPAVAPEAAELAEAPELERLLTEIQGLSDDEVHRLLAEGKAGTHRE